MSIPPDSPWRGGAAFLPQPVDDVDVLAAEFVVETIYEFNVSSSVTIPLPEIEYRSSDGEIDVRRHVFRWDRAPYDFVFQNGFEPRRQAGTPNGSYYNLELYVNCGGRPLDTRRETTHGFVSTTISSDWNPIVNRGVVDRVYRYEIYAPGGILVSQTLGERYRFPHQDEVAFPAGIAPQYIRSAQLFELSNERVYTTRRRADNFLYINRNFNPQSDPARELRVYRPVSYYVENRQWRRLVLEIVPQRQARMRPISDNIDENRQRRRLVIDTQPRPLSYHVDEIGQRRPEIQSVLGLQRRLLSLSIDPADELIEYYTKGVTNVDNYIDAAFRSTRKNEAYIFIGGEYVLMNYAPGSTNDRIVNGPHFIGSSFHSLVGTAFAEYGIDAAFGCHDRDYNEAMIFSANLCARINYAPGTTNDWIIEGPKSIRQMFPFFRGTKFERGIDAAFESTVTGEAYLFKGSEYALVDYSKPALIAIRTISDGFQCFRNTMFESDIGAAFASHAKNQAYLFKGNSYVLFHFTPGKTKDYIIGGPKEIVPANWPSLNGILPRKNRGLDICGLPQPNHPRDRDRDEL